MTETKPKKPSLAAMIEELEQERQYRSGEFKRPDFRRMEPARRAMHDARLAAAIETFAGSRPRAPHQAQARAMSSHDYLTGVLREIADLFPENPGEGLRAALAIAEAKGGTERIFPPARRTIIG